METQQPSTSQFLDQVHLLLTLMIEDQIEQYCSSPDQGYQRDVKLGNTVVHLVDKNKISQVLHRNIILISSFFMIGGVFIVYPVCNYYQLASLNNLNSFFGSNLSPIIAVYIN